jgi:hypothetical protein
MGSDGMRADLDPSGGSWGGAAVRATTMVLFSFLAFVLIPNTLLGYLATRLRPNWRDLVVVAWWGFAFVIGCASFVRFQRGGKPRA